MEKIIEPVSYKRMMEKYTQPVHTYGKKTKITEGYGAGYTLTFLGLKLTNVQVEEPQKDSDGCYTARFTADIKPGDYDFYADHPMWNLGSYVRESDKNDYLHRDWKPYSVYSYYAVPKAIIDGGKVEGVCDDRGQKWDSWDAADAQPGWTKENYVREIESEEFCVEEGYGGGWSHTPMEKEITFEAEDRGSYYHGIDLGFNSNDATLTKVTLQFDPDWVADYNDDVDRAIYGDEEDDEEDLVTYEVTGIDWDVDDDDDLDDLPYDTSIEVPGNYDEDDIIDALSDEYGFLINGVEGIKRVYESKKSRKARLRESGEFYIFDPEYQFDSSDIYNEEDYTKFNKEVHFKSKEKAISYVKNLVSYWNEIFNDDELFDHVDEGPEQIAVVFKHEDDFYEDEEYYIDVENPRNFFEDDDEDLDESKKSRKARLTEYQSSGKIENHKKRYPNLTSSRKYRKTTDDLQGGEIVEIVGDQYVNSAVPTKSVNFITGKKHYDFSKRPELGKAIRKGLKKEYPQETKDVLDALGCRGCVVKALPEGSHVKTSYIVKVLEGPSKGKELEFFPDELIYKSKDSKIGFTESKLTERLHKIEHGNGVYGYAEPGEDEWLFLANGYGASKFIGYIAAPSGKVYLKKNAPKEAFDAFPEYELLNSRFDEKASLTPGSFMYPMSYDGYDPLSDFYAIIKDEGYYEGAEYWDGEDFTEDFLDAALYDKKEDAEKELEKLFDIYGKDCPLKISSETVEPYTEKRVREFFGGEWAEPEDDENWDIDDDREDYEGTVADDIAELHYLLDKEKSGMALDSYELRVLQSLIDDYPEEYEQTLNEACIPTDNDPDIADFVSVFHDTLGGSPKKREAAIEELDGIKNSLVKTYPELEGKSPSQIARWCDNVLNGKWNGKLHEDALASEIRQRVNDVNAAKRKVDQDVEILDKKVANATQEMVKLAINHGRNGGLHEAAPRKVEVDFPIHVNKRGLIPEEDAKKVLRKLAADHKLRVGSLYDVLDADGNTTTWDFSVSTDPGFGYTFKCKSSIEKDGEKGTAYNAFYLNKKRNKVCLKDAIYVSNCYGIMDESKKLSDKSDKKRLQEGAGAGYSIIFKGIELENIKVTESDENVGDKNFHFEADIKPQEYDWSAEGYDWNTGTDWAGEFAKVGVSGKVSGAYYYYDYNGYDFDAKDAEQEIAKEKFDLGDLHYSAGWFHCDVPEHFVLDEDVDLSDERSGYKEAWVQHAELDIEADVVNAFIDDIKYGYDDEDEDFDESRKSNKSKLTEAARYTHRIELEPDDPNAIVRVSLTHPETLRYRSQEEAQKGLDALNDRIGDRLKAKGLHLEIKEIPQKPRKVASQVEGYENPFEVGDILEGDFGYNMVLPVWYEVVKVTSKQVTLKELSSIVVSHDGYGQAGVKRPNIGVYKKDWEGKEKEIRALVKKHNGWWNNRHQNPKENYYVVISNHIFDIWDGQDASFDTYD